jgi:hypothetical protein
LDLKGKNEQEIGEICTMGNFKYHQGDQIKEDETGGATCTGVKINTYTETGYEGVEWIPMAQDIRSMAGCCEQDNGLASSVRCWECLEWLSKSWLEKNSASWHHLLSQPASQSVSQSVRLTCG